MGRMTDGCHIMLYESDLLLSKPSDTQVGILAVLK